MYRVFRFVSSPILLCVAFAISLLVAFEYDFNLPNRLAEYCARAHWPASAVLTVLLLLRFFVSVLVIRWAIALHQEIRTSREGERAALLLARHDPLTDLPNRRVFKEVLGETLALLGPGESVGVMFVDFDGFKAINDFHGHGIGDEMLCQGAERLREAIGEERTLCRLGGDEFAIMCEVGASPVRLERIAARIVAAFAEPFHLHDRKLKLGASVGIAIAPKDGCEVVDVLRAADQAMYRAKKAGKGRFSLFEAKKEPTRRRTMLRSKLLDAIANREIVPFYEPIVDLSSQRICGFEALARWRRPQRSVLAPGSFLPMIEDMKLASPLALSLLEQICEDARAWPAHYRIAMNLSSSQLQDALLMRDAARTIRASGLEPARFVMEISETALLDNLQDSCAAIDSLRAQGLSVALDNFGNGASSLLHLRLLSFDRLKIDRAFVGSIDSDPRGADYVRAIVAVGKSLHLEVTAQGIETPAVLARLEEMGCQFGQGFLYSQPVPAEAIANLLQAEPMQRGKGVELRMVS